MRIYSGLLKTLPVGLGDRLNTYRYKIFVELLGWDLAVSDGVEIDQFDRSDTIYIVAESKDGRVIGCARLLPTTSPYLLGEVFPMLLGDAEPPMSPDVWELSRVAAIDLEATLPRAKGQFSSPVAIELLKESIACAGRLGAKQLVSVSPVGVDRLLRKCGMSVKCSGTPAVVDGYSLCACWVDVEPAVQTDVYVEQPFLPPRASSDGFRQGFRANAI